MTEIINFYDKLGIGKDKKLPKNWSNHYVHHNSHILLVGKTGCGKSNLVMNYLMRTSNEFYKVIIFTGSTTEEPLYKKLQECEEVEFYNEIEDLPLLSDFDDDLDNPKLLIFDDWINLSPKELKVIYKYIVSSRKYGFSCLLMAQDYKSVPKLILRNINYIILFKINDNISINNIIRNHNLTDIDKDLFKKIYTLSTDKPLDFLLLDFKTNNNNMRIRHNFLDFINLNEINDVKLLK
jgi:ABC-type dipeptide/oligopeptide/nickel transport system ATPase subunit